MKKKYVKPNVESGKAVEQTALACNVTWLSLQDVCDWGTDISTVEGCTTSPFKGGAWASDWAPQCTIFPADSEIGCAVVLS